MFYKSITLHRLLQSITWHGTVYVFYRQSKNEYGENSGEPKKVIEINGLFHNGTSNHIKILTADAGMVIDKNTPYILTSWGNAEKLKLEDTVEINGNAYKITGKENLNQFSIIGEISLGVVL